jgi:Uma2 family endonuclease
MPQVKQAVTYQDYLTLPDDRRFELIGGELCMVPSPGFFHQVIALNLGTLLRQYVKAHNLGVVLLAPMDVVLSDHDVVQPDVLFIGRARREIITDACIRGAPDLVIEIISPTHRERDLLVKKTLYTHYGVQEYWIVDPENRTIEQLLRSGEGFTSRGLFASGETLEPTALPGLALPVAQIFETT